jgi:hypothetical protein
MNFSKKKLALFASLFSLSFFYTSASNSEDIDLALKKQTESKIVIKAVEKVILLSSANSKKFINARIDTGATQSSIDVRLARELGFNKQVGHVNVISANGIKIRPLIEVDYELSGKKIKSTFTLADRSNLNYLVLIGRNDLKGFLVDPTDN